MKHVMIAMLLLVTLIPLTAEKARLGEDEIKGVKKVKFINRSTRRAAEEVREQNTATGRSLSEKMTGDTAETALDGIHIQRFLSKEDRLGGDVISLGEDANFGHINSIARILASYIQNSFQYEEGDADVLAMYILYYNALHRGDTAYINDRYTEELFGSMDAEKTGIDESYKNWPGKTQIVVPIAANILKENGKDVGTKELGDEVNKIIETKKNGTETKKKFEDLQTRKTEQEKKDIIKKEKEVLKKEQEISKKEEKVNRELAQLKQEPEKNKDAIKQKEAEKKQVETEKKQVVQEKKGVADKKKELSSSGKPSSSGTKEPAKGTEELKKELAKTKQELAEKKAEEKKKELYDENVVGGKILFLKTLKYLDKGHYNNELQMLDPVKDDMIFRGEYNNICSNTFEIFGDKVVVIGYTNNHSAKHNLVLIDQETLKKAGESEIGVFWRSPMIVKGDDLYAIEEDGETYFLVRFDKMLKRTARSAVDISPDSNVTFYGTKIYITGKQKDTGKMDIVVLKKDDLSFIKRIQP